jgi:hypothetical protein
MILRRDEPDIICIPQVDHAEVAGAVLDAWRADGWPERATREATRHATRHHDDGWLEEDAAPTVDPRTGRPHDFLSLPLDRRLAVWLRSAERVGEASAYAAALVCQHGAALARAFGHDRLMQAMEDARDRWFTGPARPAQVAGLVDPPADQRLIFLRDYTLLALADLVSLLFCLGEPTAVARDGYDVKVHDTRRVLVSPDPFGGRVVPLSVRGRRLAARHYDSDDELRQALEAAPDSVISGQLAGGPPP